MEYAEHVREYLRGDAPFLSWGYNPAMKNKASGGSQTRTVEGAYAPCASRQERRGVLERSHRRISSTAGEFKI